MACLAYPSLCLDFLGYPDQALQQSREAVRFARELAHPFSLANALLFLSWVYILRREETVAQEPLAEALSLSTQYGLQDMLLLARALQGRALIRQGNPEEGVPQIQEVCSTLAAAGIGLFQSVFLAFQADGQRELGHAERGLTAATEALALVDKSAERLYEAELYRLKGELLWLSSGRSAERGGAEIENCFQRALEVARRQQAKTWELRAASSLARLWQQKGKRVEAWELLSAVYNGFTEGFDTADLTDAKALLDQLA